MMSILPYDVLLNAYANGAFPMATGRNDSDIHWYQPTKRGVIPLDTFHVSKSLRKTLKNSPYTITCDKNFTKVIKYCASTNNTFNKKNQRTKTWINDTIINSYTTLHHMGYAHSIEIYHTDTKNKHALIGGLYGVRLGRAFFGESMFSTRPNASKIALVYLVALLRYYDFELLDCQYVNNHLLQFGCISMPQDIYLQNLHHALRDVLDTPSKNKCTPLPPIKALPIEQWRQLALNIS